MPEAAKDDADFPGRRSHRLGSARTGFVTPVGGFFEEGGSNPPHDDFLFHAFQVRELAAAVRDLPADATLDAAAAELQADLRPVAIACAMRREPEAGDVCCAGPASPGPALAFGATPLEFLRWAAAKRTAPAAARAGGRGWTDLRRGLLDCDGPPGAMTQVLAGVALSFRQRRQPRAALVFEDRLALETGRWHEGMSFATAVKAPLLVVLVPASARAARNGGPGAAAGHASPSAALPARDGRAVEGSDSVTNACAPPARDGRAPAADGVSTAAVAANYGLEAHSLDGQSPERVQEAVADARRRAVEGKGPSLFELKRPADDEDWDDPGSRTSSDDQASRVRQAKRAAAAAVAHAVARLRMEPEPTSRQALEPVLQGEAALPSWTRRDPPDPSDRLPSTSKPHEHALAHG